MGFEREQETPGNFSLFIRHEKMRPSLPGDFFPGFGQNPVWWNTSGDQMEGGAVQKIILFLWVLQKTGKGKTKKLLLFRTEKDTHRKKGELY